MSSDRRFTVTRIDGYADLAPRHGDSAEQPGASFHVIDRLSERTVETHRSEDVASGLPNHVRVNIAEFRANDAADRLEREATESLQA